MTVYISSRLGEPSHTILHTLQVDIGFFAYGADEAVTKVSVDPNEQDQTDNDVSFYSLFQTWRSMGVKTQKKETAEEEI